MSERRSCQYFFSYLIKQKISPKDTNRTSLEDSSTKFNKYMVKSNQKIKNEENPENKQERKWLFSVGQEGWVRLGLEHIIEKRMFLC